MDPIVFEILGSLLVGGMLSLTVFQRPIHMLRLAMFHRPRRKTPQTMPVLAIRKTRSVSNTRRHRTISWTKAKSNVAAPKSRKRPRLKSVEPTVESTQVSSQAINATATFSACPSCGLQAPEKLLVEHFLGSPSHRNGPPKVPATDAKKVEMDVRTKEDDSNQSVRNLLQILVPPRAFGLRHAHRSASAIPSVVQDLGPRRRHYP